MQQKLKKEDQYFINTSDILFNRLKKEISSEKKTEIKDNDENSLNTENLIIKLKDNLIITENVLLTDKDLNIYEIKNLYYDYKNKELLGKDIIVNKDNKLSLKRYLPRIKSNFFKYRK